MAASEGAAAAVNVLSKVMRYAAGLGLGASVIQTSLYTVDGGERVVVFDRFRGVLPEVVAEGTHFRIPWVQSVNNMDIRTRPHVINSATGTKDLQTVNMQLRILAKPDELQLPTIYQRLGLDWPERVLPSIGNEVVKSVVAQFNAEQLLTMRDVVSNRVLDTLRERAATFNIQIDDLAITHLSFGAEFTKAVELKQVAEQEAERAKFVVLKAEQERNAAVIRAEGESESAKLISDATKSYGGGLIELRRIEAAKDIADTMAKSRNVVYLPHTGNMLLNLPQQ